MITELKELFAAAPERHHCEACGWNGATPSITDASSVVERDGALEMDRTHLLVCPRCLVVISRTDDSARVPL